MICRTKVVVFDKTGTLTTGKPSVQDVVFVTNGMPVEPQDAQQQQHNIHGTSSCCKANAQPAASSSSSRCLEQQQRSLLALIAAVEAGSEHPLARAIMQHVTSLGVKESDAGGRIEDFVAQPGRGVSCRFVPAAAASCNGIAAAAPAAAADAAANTSTGACCNGTTASTQSSSTAGNSAAAAVPGSCCSRLDSEPFAAAAASAGSVAPAAAVHVVIGNIAWLEECGVELSAAVRQKKAQLEGQGATVMLAAVGGSVVALLAVADRIKPEAPAVLAALQQRGMQCWMITGDSR
jgi:Cu+-exporting ATPase